MEKQEANNKKQQTVVMFPFPGAGHVVPIVQLAKVFIRHGYDVTVLLVEPPFGLHAFAAGDVARANPLVSFHVLPRIPDTELEDLSGKPPLLIMLELMCRYSEALEAFLRSVVPRRRLHSLITSMFTAHAVDVTEKLRVPVYTFFASAAPALAVTMQVPAFMVANRTRLKELGETRLEFLGAPPFPASHLFPEVMEHPEGELSRSLVHVWTRIPETKGILVNSFESLAPRAVQALRDPRCVLGRMMPPIYCIGPLVSDGQDHQAAAAKAPRHKCLDWLNAQPKESVVFLCFGSRGVLSAEQLREIAVGLDRSGHRFLWTVRKPEGTKDDSCGGGIDTLMPPGFLERTKDRGMVIESWAPQMDVLRHPSTGAFVTHCGWNSTLEAITSGVPVLCWPLYAEQMLNKVLLTVDMRVGVELKGYITGFIAAEEVETKVRLVLESEEGRNLRARVLAIKKEAEMAIQEGGSSHSAFVQFLLDVKNLKEQEQEQLDGTTYGTCAPSLCA